VRLTKTRLVLCFFLIGRKSDVSLKSQSQSTAMQNQSKHKPLGLRKQRKSREVATRALAKRRLSNERSASDWLKHAGISFQPIRSTTLIWVVTRHQYGISALFTQTSFCEGSSGDLAKHRLFSQAKNHSKSKTRLAHTSIWRATRTQYVLLERWNLFSWVVRGALKVKDRKASNLVPRSTT